jgi:hypothetical protein
MQPVPCIRRRARLFQEEGGYGYGGGADMRRFITYSGSGAGNCVGPHGHPENCSEKGAKHTGHKPTRGEAERAQREEEKLAKNAGCAIAGGVTGGWAGVGVGWLCSEIF